MSLKPRERYQTDEIFVLNFELNQFKHTFTMMNYFAMYGWIIPSNDNKAETILTTFLNESSHIIYLIDIRHINDESSSTILFKNFMNRNELQEFMECIITFSIKE